MKGMPFMVALIVASAQSHNNIIIHRLNSAKRLIQSYNVIIIFNYHRFGNI